MTLSPTRAGIALLTLTLAVAATAVAGEPTTATEEVAGPATDVLTSPRVTVVDGSLDSSFDGAPARPNGMIVAIDPETGERRPPTADEAADLSAAARFRGERPEGADLQQFELRGGGAGLLLDSRHLVSETVELRLDGSLLAGHRMGATERLGFLQPALSTGEPADDAATPATDGGTTDTAADEGADEEVQR